MGEVLISRISINLLPHELLHDNHQDGNIAEPQAKDLPLHLSPSNAKAPPLRRTTDVRPQIRPSNTATSDQ